MEKGCRDPGQPRTEVRGPVSLQMCDAAGISQKIPLLGHEVFV